MKKRRLTPLGWVILAIVITLGFVLIPPFILSFRSQPINCKGFADTGIVNIPKGNGNYVAALDRNKDGIACEK